ncbi:MAG: hypothetical protein SGJ13_15560 [Actinomycetota bacterium]|nr:hypothetical protein [Actinomycetota bacterium]
MAGAVIILLVLFVIGPIAIMFGGAIWSALMGLFLTENAEPPPEPDSV